MEKSAGQNRAADYLYPACNPFSQKIISVSGGHQIYVERCGNPEGIPVIVLHGGPGGGCNPNMRRYFNPKTYHIILFDQRGCGRSKPHASVENNTTWDLIADIEIIRALLSIDRWVVFGGSWGATLSLLYAETHPNRVSYLILRGVFLMTGLELDWFYGGGAGKFFPEHWGHFKSMIPAEEQNDLILAYHKRLFSGNPIIEKKFASVWSGWETSLAAFGSERKILETPSDYGHAFARLESHYFYNKGFLTSDSQIMDNISSIQAITGTIVQGRYDMICPPTSAHKLAQSWKKANLVMIPNAGHSLSEPGITEALVKTTNYIASTPNILRLS